MIPIPKFRLGKIFLFFFCYAVGLAMARDALGAVEPTIAMAMLIGVGQETKRLWRWTPPSPPPRASFTFAHSFAIFWRCVVGLTIFAHFVLEFIQAAFPHSLNALAYDRSMVSAEMPETYVMCVLIVLCNSIERWRPKTHSISAPRRRTRWLALLAMPLGAVVLLNATLMMYLVHWAGSSIEAGQSARFRRPGVYITPVDENLFSYWLGSLAVLSLLVGAALLLRFIRRRNFAFASLWNLAAIAPLLAAAAIFSIWFFTIKFQKLSPDMFGNGLEATRSEWLFGCILGGGVAAVVAYRLASSREFSDPPITDVEKNPEAVPFHQNPAIVFLIGLSGLYDFFGIRKYLLIGSMSFPRTLSGILLFTLSDPRALIVLATSIASVQLCWIRWRYRTQLVQWRLAAVSRPAYYESFIATIIILAIAVPTLHAYAFICWLMPWNLMQLFL